MTVNEAIEVAYDPRIDAARSRACLVLAKEVKRLQAIVDKLPETFDGAPAVPGEKVWCNGVVTYDNGGTLTLVASEQRLLLTIEGAGTFVGQSYSTQEAAKAALAGGDRQAMSALPGKDCE